MHAVKSFMLCPHPKTLPCRYNTVRTVLYIEPCCVVSCRAGLVSFQAVAVLGTGGLGPKSPAGPLFENFLLTKIILQVFFVKFLYHKGILKFFPVISFQFFLRCGAPSALPKVRGLGAWPPRPPLKPPLFPGLDYSCKRNTKFSHVVGGASPLVRAGPPHINRPSVELSGKLVLYDRTVPNQREITWYDTARHGTAR